jgi:tRNA pseudouridine55 synthase
MDGLLVIDKPCGPTSHDVVARVRRATGERRIGHTGTLDPAASGVLPLVLGRATRLARFLSGSDKSYEAVIRLGVATDTYDADGVPLGPPYDGPLPSLAEIEQALDSWRGTSLQQPPRYSAKKIDGTRSYKLARADRTSAWPGTRAPEPVSVTAHTIDILGREGELLTLRVACSAGFYIRSLAHDLGGLLGIGAHLARLERTQSGGLTLADAVSLDALERALEDDRDAASCWLIPLSGMLSHLPSVVLTEDEALLVAHGRDVEKEASGPLSGNPLSGNPLSGNYVRLLDLAGNLIGIAEPTAGTGLLHPSVVLV